MTTTTQKKKLSKSAWFLIFLLIAVIVAVTVMAVIGYISLAFIADWLVGTMMFGSGSWVSAALVLATPFVVGIVTFWVVKTYFIGDKTKSTIGTGGYTPTPVYPSQAQQDTETVIS